MVVCSTFSLRYDVVNVCCFRYLPSPRVYAEYIPA